MMDLTRKGLPNVVEIDGSPYSVYTDYRLWMRFENDVMKMQQGDLIDVSYLFKNGMPLYCSVTDLFAFSRPRSVLPRSTGDSDVIALDYELDGELIYAAFLGQYGIDLIDVEELHWHKFLALLKGLNGQTKLREVMGYRCYEKREPDKNRDAYEELRRAWEIERISPAKQKEAEKFSDYFD